MNPAALTMSPAVLVGLRTPGADGLGGPLMHNPRHRYIDFMVTVHPKWCSAHFGGFSERKESSERLACVLY